jgi:hypothetical protein
MEEPSGGAWLKEVAKCKKLERESAWPITFSLS